MEAWLYSLQLLIFTFVGGVPACVIAQRRGIKNARLDARLVAFVPVFGFWIILFQSIGRSSVFSALVLIPVFGQIIPSVWTALEVPSRHGRSSWWTAALIVPYVNLIGYWAYAFTLPKQATPVLQEAVA
jgi:hypothetical protein